MPTRPTSGYDNEEIPDSMPLQNQGAIPVLVRLVDGELGEHFRPAEARRWTETHVMCSASEWHQRPPEASDAHSTRGYVAARRGAGGLRWLFCAVGINGT
jgi:hypothetical protein